jgi:hypothetical protein
MRRYRSHKIVEADRIKDVDLENAAVLGELDVYEVPSDFFARGVPEPGDYIVRYADGYLSWSPAIAFEAGYTMMEAPSPGAEDDPAYASEATDPGNEDERLAWISARASEANLSGAAWHRFSLNPATGLMLYEGWRPRFAGSQG